MYFRATINLVRGGRPVFIGWLDQFINNQLVPLTVDDIDSITFSMSMRKTDTVGEYSRIPGSTPLENFQNIPVEKTTAITPPTLYEPEFYQILGMTPFESNFIYSPENNPVLFESAGLYVARFEFTDINGEIHPAEIEITVR